MTRDIQMAAAPCGGSFSAPSLRPPRPKSPPECPDLRGKRRDMAKVQKLEREIGFLQEEIKSIEGFQPASRCCKEIADFVVANSDPLMPIKHRKDQKTCGFWNWLCGMACSNMACLCCSCHSECSCHLKCPGCCDPCRSCPTPGYLCFLCSRTCSCGNISCRRSFCVLRSPFCGDCLCCRCKCSSLKCFKVPLFCCNPKTLCCNPC